MYRFQGTNNRSNGIYCEPENTHFTPPHANKKSSKMRHHHRSRSNNRSHNQHLPQSRNDTGMDSEADSSSDASEGTYQESDVHGHASHPHPGMALANRLNIAQNGGADSPPEPAPSEIPMRMNGGLRSLKPYVDRDMDPESELSAYHHVTGPGLYLPQEYLMSSPYQPKSPMPMGASLATAKKLFQSDNLQNETADSNSTLSTLPSQARLIGGLGPPSSNPLLTGIPQAPVILPVFPASQPHGGQAITGNGTATNSRSLQRNQYSPSRFTLQKDCHVSDRCSWKCISIALILLCIALISILIYTAAIMGNCSRYTGTGCIVVEDAKVLARGEKSFPVIDLTSMSPKNSEELASPTTVLPPELTSRDFGRLNESPLEILWGQPLFRQIEPYSFWTLEVNMRESAYVNLNLSFPWLSNWALIFRKNALPSITQHDLIKVVKNGRIEHRNKRRHVRWVLQEQDVPFSDERNSTGYSTNVPSPPFSRSPSQGLSFGSLRGKRETYTDQSIVVFSEYLDSGKWFLRIFNDDQVHHRVGVVAQVDNTVEMRCPLQCSGNGNCVHGKCHCLDGFNGVDCSNSICPVLCSNHGRFSGGFCFCESGWKGTECDIPETECEVGNCNGNGDCIGGKCVCKPGWTGNLCENRDCVDPTCSSHGACTNGRCLCDEGFVGPFCNVPDSILAKCIPDCSGRGDFDAESGRCICRKPFVGPTCMEVLCEKDCGRSGVCNESGLCECKEGWAGENCDMVACDPRCQEHGQCKNGSCVCGLGWFGTHCTLAGCPNACSRHGSCIMQDNRYVCKCSDSWAGEDCSIRLETNCSDDIDNDDDGMTDCSDSECCEDPKCKDHIMCMTASDPVEVLLRKQPPSVTSSFFQRVKFLIEENSVQSYAQKDEYSESQFWSSFDPRRVSVIRGQVLSPDGLGIIGIRVSVSDKKSRFGFTITRKGGWFDILVNGGGSVTLQFQRIPFQATTRTVFVPWNEIVVLDPAVIMSVGGSHQRVSAEDVKESSQEPCVQHDIEMLNPVVMSSWLPGMIGANPEDSVVFGESQILQESIVIPGSDVHLIYQSSQSPGYLATIMMQLTGPTIPPGLVLVHLKITIEGELHSQTFEADPNITYSFGWKKRNVYQQKVYGLAVARVAIGYQYAQCQKPVWTMRTVTLKGFDVDIADVGGWNLDIHHHYNFHEGILQKGDGSEVHLKDMPRIVSTIMGHKGQQRSLLCEPCENLLLSPIDLATGPDGSIYVGDFNLIRRITPENKVYTILQLSATKVSHQYYMTVSPADGHLYISDPEKYQVLKVNSMDEIEDPRVNWVPVVGAGLKCLPGDSENCGDGFKAKLAKLIHPKGIAITMDGAMYIADGPSIRFVDVHGVIHTLVGNHGHRLSRSGVAKITDFESCRIQREDVKKVQLQWPTNLALNHVENRLMFIDEGILFQITDDNQVERALRCDASQKLARPLLDLALSPKGQLYFVSEDSNLFTMKRDGEAVLLRTDKVFPYGPNSTDERQQNNLNAGYVSALSIGADGTILVADQINLEIKQVSSFIPLPNSNGDYEVVFPATGEIYYFNRYGQHISTKDIKSGKTLYSFLYTKNTSYGKLSKITDAAENKILFLRDYSSVVSTIENTQGKKCNLKINHLGRLVHFQEMENSEIRLEYSDDGLLSAKTTTTGLSSVYAYDHFGRIRQVISETGVITNFEYDLVGEAIQVRVSDSVSKSDFLKYTILRNDETDQVIISKVGPGDATLKRKVIQTDVKNVSFSLKCEDGAELTGLSWGIYPLLKEVNPPMFLEGNLMRGPSHQQLTDGETSSRNKHEWKFGLLGDASRSERILDRQMWVNDSRVLSLEFDQSLSREVVYSRDREPVFFIQYDKTGLPLYFIPFPSNDFRSSMNITYDRFNRIESWRWGYGRGLQVTYGRNGFATEVKNSNGVRMYAIEYNEYGQPSQISLQTGRTFALTYDMFGGLKSVETPKNSIHSFSLQHSIGMTKLVYQPPSSGPSKPAFLKYFNSYGLLESIVLPQDSGRVMYEYDVLKRPTQMYYSEGKISRKYKSKSVTISIAEGKFESTSHIWTNGVQKLVQEKKEYGTKLGLSSSKFVYEYDSNFRPTLIKAKVGGNVLGDFPFTYNLKTGVREQIGPFRVSQLSYNQTTSIDGNAVFSQISNEYGGPLQYSLTIQDAEVFRMELAYQDTSYRIRQIKVSTKNAGLLPVRNFTYDGDGQLVAVESAEPWKFEYDANGNLQSLAYRGNPISLRYNAQDQIVRFGEKQYKYDMAGRVVQNAREEFFTYNSLGQLRKAWKKGRFDVEYFYDHENRLVARKDNHGNTTQFLYADVTFPRLVTHIYSPRENRLLHLVYDEAERLIYFQVNRNPKYYVASDHCGTPLLIFNQFGQTVREFSRSPYGHIIYDSDPYFYLPIDFCGGIYDQVTSLVHTKDNRVYDPLIGQYLTPEWETVLLKLKTPEKLHLYRLSGNDPINLKDSTPAFDHHSWLEHLGYNLESLAPQMFPKKLGVINQRRDLVVSGLESRVLEKTFDTPLLGTIPRSVVTKSTLVPDPAGVISQIDPPLGKSMLLSRTADGKAMISCPFCSNRIYRDVFTMILNGSEFLKYVSHSPSQDTFHFAKKEFWKASDDLAELKRIGGQVNVTVHDQSAENQMMHVKITMSGAIISVKYGLPGSREEGRLLHHAKAVAGKKAWANVKDHISTGFPLPEFTVSEKEEILKVGHLSSHHHEFIHDPDEYPFFADDPLNIRITKKSKSQRSRNNNNNSSTSR